MVKHALYFLEYKEEVRMDIWSNICRICDCCGVRYAPRRDISYKHRHYCSQRCKEDFIDVEAQVLGLGEPKGTGEDNPGRDLFDWALSFSRV